jgi:hypothetical protein
MTDKDSAKPAPADKSVKPSGEAEFVTPPNYLKMKVGTGGIDKEALKEAEIAVQVLGHKMYAKWADTDLDRMKETFERLKTTNLDDPAGIRTMLRICWDMKGLGGTFGYPLVTTITHYLSNYLEHCLEHSEARVVPTIVTAHIDALNVVLTQKISGDGGVIGRELVIGLEKVVLKTGARIGGRG